MPSLSSPSLPCDWDSGCDFDHGYELNPVIQFSIGQFQIMFDIFAVQLVSLITIERYGFVRLLSERGRRSVCMFISQMLRCFSLLTDNVSTKLTDKATTNILLSLALCIACQNVINVLKLIKFTLDLIY